jgi:hypothetical protein
VGNYAGNNGEVYTSSRAQVDLTHETGENGPRAKSSDRKGSGQPSGESSIVFVEIKLTVDTMFSSLLFVALTAPTIVKVPSNLKDVHAPWSQYSLLPSELQSFQSEKRGVHPNEEHRTGPNAMTQRDIPLQELPTSTGSSQFYHQPVSGYF